MATAPRVNLEDLYSDRFAPIQDAILSFTPVDDQARLRSTSKALKASIDGRRDWDRILKIFVDGPLAFRSWQGKVNALVTGDIILDYFGQSKHFQQTDPFLVIFAPGGDPLLLDGTQPVCDYIESLGYYSLERIREWVDRYDRVFAKDSYPEGPQPRIAIILNSPYPPCESSISTFLDKLGHEFTSEWCFATWNKVYALHPMATFGLKEIYLMRDFHGIYDEGWEENDQTHEFFVFESKKIKEYTKLGYKVKDQYWHYESDTFDSEKYNMMTRPRYLGDKHSWTLSLSTDGVTNPNIPDAVLELTSFRLVSWDRDEDHLPSRYIISDGGPQFNHPALQHNYVIPRGVPRTLVADPHDTPIPEYLYQQHDQYNYIVKRLDTQLLLELKKFEKHERPQCFMDCVREVKSGRLTECYHQYWSWEKPKWWVYWDDDFREMYKTWSTLEHGFQSNKKRGSDDGDHATVTRRRRLH